MKRPKTQAERLADLVERREAEGLRRATFWLSEKARAVIAEASRVNRSSRDRAVEDGMLAFAALGFQQPAVESKALVLTDAKTGALEKLPEPEKPVSRPKVAGKVSKAAPGPSGGVETVRAMEERLFGPQRRKPGSLLKKDAKR